jgi:hypothetical protein
MVLPEIDLSKIEVVQLDEHKGNWRRFELRPNAFPVAICCTPALLRMTNRSGFEALAECAVQVLPYPPLLRVNLEVHVATPGDNHQRVAWTALVAGDAPGRLIGSWSVFQESRRRTGKRGNGPWKHGPASFRFDLFIPARV